MLLIIEKRVFGRIQCLPQMKTTNNMAILFDSKSRSAGILLEQETAGHRKLCLDSIRTLIEGYVKDSKSFAKCYLGSTPPN